MVWNSRGVHAGYLVKKKKYIHKFMSNPKMSMNSFVKIVKEDCMWKYHSIVFIGQEINV